MEVLKGELNSTSTYVYAQLTKDQLLVHHINTLTKINVKIKITDLLSFFLREKGRYLTQPNDKRPYTHRKIQKAT